MPPTHQRTSLPGPCSLSPWPSPQVSLGGCRWVVPGVCLPSTRPPAHTWGETSPVPPPLCHVFTKPLCPRKLECKELVCRAGAGGVSLFPDLLGCREGRKVGREVTWASRRRCQVESEIKTIHLLACPCPFIPTVHCACTQGPTLQPPFPSPPPPSKMPGTNPCLPPYRVALRKHTAKEESGGSPRSGHVLRAFLDEGRHVCTEEDPL